MFTAGIPRTVLKLAIKQVTDPSLLRNWIVLFSVSGVVWMLMPTNILIFFPIVIFWFVICVWITAGVVAFGVFLLSLLHQRIEDD